MYVRKNKSTKYRKIPTIFHKTVYNEKGVCVILDIVVTWGDFCEKQRI